MTVKRVCKKLLATSPVVSVPTNKKKRPKANDTTSRDLFDLVGCVWRKHFPAKVGTLHTTCQTSEPVCFTSGPQNLAHSRVTKKACKSPHGSHTAIPFPYSQKTLTHKAASHLGPQAGAAGGAVAATKTEVTPPTGPMEAAVAGAAAVTTTSAIPSLEKTEAEAGAAEPSGTSSGAARAGAAQVPATSASTTLEAAGAVAEESL